MGLLRRVSRRITRRYLLRVRPAGSAAAEMVATAQLLAAIRDWSREEPAPRVPEPRLSTPNSGRLNEGMTRDWVRWHEDYEAPQSSLARRLAVVRREIRRALGEAPRSSDGGRRLISMCAGDGRDVLPVLAEHPAGRDVSALLVELDPSLSGRARQTAADLGLDRVEVRNGDAGRADTYRDFGRAHIALACGVFGNITVDDMRRTVAALPSLLVPGGIAIWTRGRGHAPGDHSDEVRRSFASHGFTELAFTRPGDSQFRVGMARLTVGARSELEPGASLFAFI